MRILFLISLFLATTLPAHAIKFSVVGAANRSEPEVSPATASYTGDFDFGGGALLEFGLVPSVGLEFGALYVPRKFDSVDATGTITTTNKMKMWEFPVLLRAYLADVLSIGVGGYYAQYKDQIEYDTRTLGSSVSSTGSYSAANLETSDYGLATSLALYIPFTPLARFMLDGRYNVGVKDNSTTSAERKYNDILVLAGFQLGF